MTRDQLVKIMEAISESARNENINETSEAICAMTEEQYGTVPLVIRLLSERPDVCIPAILKNLSLFSGKRALDAKTAELIAVSSAVANRCEFCMNVHMEKALSHGATLEEVFETILISSSICESSAWAVAFREFRKFQGGEKTKGMKKG